MTRANVLWLGTLAVLIAGLAIDRSATNRQLTDLRHKYSVIAEAAANEGTGRGYVPLEQPAPLDLANARAATQRVPAPARAAPSAAGASQPPSSDSESAAAPEPPSWSDQMARLDTVFAEEPPDRNWSRAAEGQLTDALSPLAVGGARIQQVTCRSTLCKVKVEHTTEDGVRDLLNEAFALRRSWKGAVATMRDLDAPKGTFSGAVYFSKEGHDLPLLTD